MNAINQCLRCGNLRADTANFCENCQLSLRDSSKLKLFQTEVVPCPQTKVLPATLMVRESDDIDNGPLAVRLLPSVRRRTTLKRLRKIFAVLSLLFGITLIVDGILVTLVFTHSSVVPQHGEAFPLLTLTPGNIYLGQVVQLHLSHFSPSSHVILTRDARESIRVDAPSSLIQVERSGNAIVHVLVGANWGIGSHLIAAEDTQTRYIASVTLEVIGAGPVLPPQLQLSQTSLDMGIDWPEAHTLRTLKLANSGGGIISWAAKSDQPWLQLTPTQGIFSAGQMISLVVTRTQMPPGTYQSILSISSNTGVPAFIQIKMSVRPLRLPGKPVLIVTPAVLTFSAIDGEREPADQLITITNSSRLPLAWSITRSMPTSTINQSIPFQTLNWLSTFPASGALAPRASATIRIQAHSHMLFPGVYSGFLNIVIPQALDTPQVIAVSLDVQQQCGIVTDVGVLSFIATSNQRAADSQDVGLHATTGCSGTIAWSASTLTDWLAVTPANGQVQERGGNLATVSVDRKLLQPGIFTGLVIFFTEHRTQTITVRLTVLPTSVSGKFPDQTTGLSNVPVKSTPSMGKITSSTPAVSPSVSPSGTVAPPLLSVLPPDVTFTVPQGQTNSGAQWLTFANTGGHALIWRVSINGSATSWLLLASTSGSLGSQQTASLSVDTSAANLALGTYKAQIVVNALDSSGIAVSRSPQIISVVLNVVQPCVLQVTPSTLSFSASLLQPNPADQSISMSVMGNCSLPVSWQANSGSSAWLIVSPASGILNGTVSSINVHVDTSGKLLGRYKGQITLSAQDSTGASIKISSPTIFVTLDVLG